eukprot:SAG31_NODE_5340_length_2600_cov_1.800880_2_plen_274_part_01
MVNIGGVRAAIPSRSPSTVPARIPQGYLGNAPEHLPAQTVQQLRWLMQKSMLGEDVFLIGPPGRARRHVAMAFAELFKREIEIVSISADTTEADLKQRREIVNGDAVFVDQAPVRAALCGGLLLLDGIERAERNVLPTLNNLLESREMALEDGRTIVSAATWQKMLNENGLSKQQLAARGICRAHPDFLTIAIGAPVPPFPGKLLDPPLRSRFQGISSGPLDSESLFDTLTAIVKTSTATAATLVEFSESVLSLARAGTATGQCSSPDTMLTTT